MVAIAEEYTWPHAVEHRMDEAIHEIRAVRARLIEIEGMLTNDEEGV